MMFLKTCLASAAASLLSLSHATEGIAQVAPREGAASALAARPFQPAYLRVGLGTTSDVSSYYPCARLSVEYAPLLTRRLGLASRLVGVAGKPTSELERQAPNQNYKAAYVEQEVLYYPFGHDQRVRFAVGAGGFAGYYKQNSFDFLQATNGQLTDYGLRSYQGVHAGYLGSLQLEVALGQQQRWLLGLKSTIQNGTGGVTTLTTHSLTMGRRL